jgi:hypothetical protein
MFDHMDGEMRTFAKKRTQWKGDLFFVVKLAQPKLSKYHTEVTATTGIHLMSTHILDLFRKFQSFRKRDKGLDINPEDKTSYTTQYLEAFLRYVENENCAKHRRVPVNKLETIPSSNLVPSATTSGSCQSSFDPYDSSNDDEEYLTPNNVAETTPRRSDCTAHLLTAPRLYFNSLPEAPKNWEKLIQISMITTSTQSRLACHLGYRTEPIGGDNRRKRTQSTPISAMCRATYSLSYHMVSEWRPAFLLTKMLLGGGSQKLLAGPFAKKLS